VNLVDPVSGIEAEVHIRLGRLGAPLLAVGIDDAACLDGALHQIFDLLK
jgi:hypothetical protein